MCSSDLTAGGLHGTIRVFKDLKRPGAQMSDAHSEDTGFIKTPTQLIVIVVLAFAVLIGIPVMVSQLVTSGSKQGADHPAMVPEEVARRIKPVGDVVVADPNAPKVLKAGKEIVEQVCQACHATGALKAPKIGDNAAWGALAKQGLATLTASAVKDRKSTRLNSSHSQQSRMPSSA